MRRRSLLLRATAFGAAAWLSWGSLACAGEGSSGGAAETAGRVARHLNPVSSWETQVMSAVRRGQYLEARLFTTDLDLTMIFPWSGVCEGVLEPEAAVTWQRDGNFGYAHTGGDERCHAIGVASLAAWRDRRSRRTRGGAFPRDTARFREIFRDEEIVQLRGRFRLAGMVSIPGGIDLVAFVPNTEPCQVPIGRGNAALEFRDAGRVPFRLGTPRGTCPVAGFAQPIPDVAAPTDE